MIMVYFVNSNFVTGEVWNMVLVLTQVQNWIKRYDFKTLWNVVIKTSITRFGLFIEAIDLTILW